MRHERVWRRQSLGTVLFSLLFSLFFFVWPACLSDPCRMQSRAGRRKGQTAVTPVRV